MALFANKKALESIEDRCRALEHRSEDSERAFKGLQLEWEELYDKVRRQMSRMSKRIAVDEKEASDFNEPEDGTGSASGVDSISARILKRRAGHGGKP